MAGYQSPADTVLELAADGSEALAYLRGSPSTLAALQIVRAFRASWDELRPGLQDAEERGIVPRGTADARLAVWAFAVALSRIARFASRPDIEALVPWIDMFNHSPNARSFIDLAGTQEVVVQADRAYRPGDEVFISYGQKSSSELLLSYGFAPVHHECDSAWVPLGLPPSPSRSGGDEHRQRVVRALAARGDFLTATRSDVVELSEDFAVLLVRVGAAGQVPEGVMQAALCVAACEGVPGADVKAWVDRTMSLPEDRLTKEHTALAAGTLADACSLALKVKCLGRPREPLQSLASRARSLFYESGPVPRMQGFARKMQDNVDLLRSMETAGGAAAAAPREAPHQPSPSRPMSTGRPQAKCAPSGAGDDRGRSMEATVTALLPSWAAVGSTNAGKGRAASPAPSGARRRGKRADPSPAGAEAPDERDRRVAVQVLRAVVAEQRVIAGAEFALRRFVRSASR